MATLSTSKKRKANITNKTARIASASARREDSIKKRIRTDKTSVKKPSSGFYPYALKRHGDLTWQKRRMDVYLKTFEEYEREVIGRAYAYAKERHDKLVRADGSPYIIHPVRIANILMKEWSQNDALLIAASLLHDVVEDTQTTIKDVKDEFGEDVGKLVDGVTMWKGSETPEVYLRRISRGPGDLRLIKLADTLDNLRSWHECGDDISDKFPRWWRQVRDYVIPMAQKTYEPAAKLLNDMIEDPWYLKRANMS